MKKNCVVRTKLTQKRGRTVSKLKLAKQIKFT